jgi:Acyl-protein synthetase, LuxE
MELSGYRVFEAGKEDFRGQALEMFRFQVQNNAIYRSFAKSLGADPDSVKILEQIPFLPISFFKTHDVKTTDFVPEAIFGSSGTTLTGGSRHLVKDLALYRKSFTAGFERSYGSPAGYCIIGLLPSYLERSNSSLVVMVDELIRLSGHPDSGFYLYEHDKLAAVLKNLEASGQKTLLIGVSFALLDFAEKHSFELKHTLVMETGGMKGRRREMIRQELHAFLTERWGVSPIHAEYGMTELLSQAYSTGHGQFVPPPWMKLLIRREDDPFDVNEEGEGILNIIDLANKWSCCFLATDDVGKVYPGGSFEVSGRVDNSDIRGCSLMLM